MHLCEHHPFRLGLRRWPHSCLTKDWGSMPWRPIADGLTRGPSNQMLHEATTSPCPLPTESSQSLPAGPHHSLERSKLPHIVASPTHQFYRGSSSRKFSLSVPTRKLGVIIVCAESLAKNASAHLQRSGLVEPVFGGPHPYRIPPVSCCHLLHCASICRLGKPE